MNVNTVGAASPGLDLQALNALPGLASLPRPSHAVSLHDSVSVWLGEMASAPIQHLLQGIEDRLAGPQHSDAVHGISHSAVGLQSAGLQDPVRSLDGIALDARDAADKSVARAAHAIETAGDRTHRIPANVDPQTVLAIANRFIETGQLPNYLRAAELGRVVSSWYDEHPPVAIDLQSLSGARRWESRLSLRYISALRKLWQRVPLLVLLAGWMAGGIVVGFALRIVNPPGAGTAWALNLWALGFLALVVFQFVVVTIRSASGRQPGSAGNRK